MALSAHPLTSYQRHAESRRAKAYMGFAHVIALGESAVLSPKRSNRSGDQLRTDGA
jgi:hypothetical protein